MRLRHSRHFGHWFHARIYFYFKEIRSRILGTKGNDNARKRIHWSVRCTECGLLPYRKALVRYGNTWSLDIRPTTPKPKWPLEYVISAEPSARINIYVDLFRPRIPGGEKHEYLWASNRRRPMGDAVIFSTVRQCAREALGFPVNLHRLRTAAATFGQAEILPMLKEV